MKIVLLTNRDLASFKTARQLLSMLPNEDWLCLMTETVGKPGQLIDEGLLGLKNYEHLCLEGLLGVTTDGQGLQQAMADALGIPIYGAVAINQGESLGRLRSFEPDLILSIRFGAILNREVISLPKLGVLNLHSGLLPEFQGIMATFWAMLFQSLDYGFTIHSIVDAKIDRGPIIHRQSMALDPAKDYLTQLLALYEVAIPVLAEQIATLEQRGVLPQTPQVAPGRYFGLPTSRDISQFKALGLKLF